jgi:predicted sulfurtransferase
LFLYAIFSFTACESKGRREVQPEARTQASPAASVAAMPSDGVRRVTLAELQEALSKKEAIAVDVRGPVEYELGHISGARSLPLGLIASRIKELPRDKLIVAYCA